MALRAALAPLCWHKLKVHSRPHADAYIRVDGRSNLWYSTYVTVQSSTVLRILCIFANFAFTYTVTVLVETRSSS
jgi:hypothetical protein